MGPKKMDHKNQRFVENYARKEKSNKGDFEKRNSNFRSEKNKRKSTDDFSNLFQREKNTKKKSVAPQKKRKFNPKTKK